MSVSKVVFFETKLDWVGLAYLADAIQKLTFGHQTREEAEACFELEKLEIAELEDASNSIVADWIEEICKYGRGDEYRFDDLKVDISKKTDFQKLVIQHCRMIPHGQSITYGELADRVGSHGAARAVGMVMKTNPIPLIIPCHRVVARQGLGGFSAPRGVGMKRSLLELEGNISEHEHQGLLF